MMQRVKISEIDLPKTKRKKENVRWLCDSLGLIKGRDLEQTSLKIMNEMLELFSKEKIISTEEIAKTLDIEPPTINHHIRYFMGAGIVVRKKRKIALRGGSLTSAIEEMKKDTDRIFEKILEVSKKIDKSFKIS